MTILKNVVFLALVIFGISSCSPMQMAGVQGPQPNMIMGQVDENEYEVQIYDEGFKRWFARHARPVNVHTQEYYELMNNRYAGAWNEKATAKKFSLINSPFKSTINYDPTIDYGLEIDYILFYYFQYVEHRHGRLLPA